MSFVCNSILIDKKEQKVDARAVDHYNCIITDSLISIRMYKIGFGPFQQMEKGSNYLSNMLL